MHGVLTMVMAGSLVLPPQLEGGAKSKLRLKLQGCLSATGRSQAGSWTEARRGSVRLTYTRWLLGTGFDREGGADEITSKLGTELSQGPSQSKLPLKPAR